MFVLCPPLSVNIIFFTNIAVTVVGINVNYGIVSGAAFFVRLLLSLMPLPSLYVHRVLSFLISFLSLQETAEP